jgi:hypothetical protein
MARKHEVQMSCRCDRAGWIEGHDQGCPYASGKTPWFEDTIAELKAEVARQARLAAVWREILDAVSYEARRIAICRTCPSNECQIRELCTSATACRSLYTLAVASVSATKDGKVQP